MNKIQKRKKRFYFSEKARKSRAFSAWSEGKPFFRLFIGTKEFTEQTTGKSRFKDSILIKEINRNSRINIRMIEDYPLTFINS